MNNLRKCIVMIDGNIINASFHRWCDSFEYTDTGQTICDNLKIFDKLVVTKAIVELPDGTVRVLEIEKIKFIASK